MELTIEVLGSGTSVGVPTIGCHCKVCTSADPRDRRLRPSVLVSFGGRNVLIDTGPDFRQQALRSGFQKIDAILYTHGHADHVLGLDDVRPFNFMQSGNIPIYASEATMSVIKRCFDYIFYTGPVESSRPRIDAHVFEGGVIPLFGVDFVPVPLNHGKGITHGFRFGNVAYLTDHSDIPESSLGLLEGLDVLFLDALRLKPHPTHTTLDRAVAWSQQLKPRRTFLTHMCHDLGHEHTESKLPPEIRLSYDGLKIVSEVEL